ncbi:MAG: Hsp20/alpha crystallin family protein [candidate division KSB1 bacterium]|nr:Hsp20/alpha crystallin family protein [candidate division KSB1 bacterium]
MASRAKRVIIELASPRGGYSADILLARGYSMIVTGTMWNPNTDIFETDEEVVIRMEAAGLDKNRLHVTLQGDRLIVRGYRPESHPCTPVTYQQMEISYGPFEKIFVLPDEVRNNPIRAVYRNGMLEIHVAKENPEKKGPFEVELETE